MRRPFLSLVPAFVFGGFLLLHAEASVAHAGTHDDAAWRACDDQALSDDCTFMLHQNIRARGTCRSVHDDLICVRNRPYETVDTDAAEGGSWSLPLAGASTAVLLPGLVGLMWLRRRRRGSR